MKPTLGDAPIEEEYEAKMNAIAMTLDKFFNGDHKGKDRKVGFFVNGVQFRRRMTM
jgi:hypothetical protein